MQISIIIPIYNGEKTLTRCINSILSQTYTDYEVLLINDGSTDKSEEICKNIVKNDNRFKYFAKENGGAGSARNLGLQKCLGKYVVFPDCDDWLSKFYLEKMIDTMMCGSLDLCICNVRHYEGNGANKKYVLKYNGPNLLYKTHDDIYLNYIKLLKLCFVQGPSDKMYKISIIKENNILFPDLRRSQDIVFNLDYLSKCNNIKLIKDDLYFYCIGNTSGKIRDDYLDIVYYLCLRWDKIRETCSDTQEWDEYLENYIVGSIYVMILSCISKGYSSSSIREVVFTESYYKLKEYSKGLQSKKIRLLLKKTIVFIDNYILFDLMIFFIKLRAKL